MSKGNCLDGAMAVYGAAGHTGRFVVDEIERRGLRAIRIGRDRNKLAATGARARIAHVDDKASLDAALEGAALVINCAGTIFDTALPMIDAAINAGIPYLDVASGQTLVRSVFETRDAPARAAGVPILPGAAFYGGLADLLASAVVGEGDKIDKINVFVGLDSWHPTVGTRLTGQRNTAPRMYQRLGRFEPIATPPATGRWNFPEPIGSREIVVLPFSEIMTLASHLKADLIESWMNVEPLRDLRDSATPPPQPSDETGRSSQRFAMEVVVDVGGQSRRATAVGQDIYFVTAPIMVEAAKRLMAGDTKLAGGVHALGAMFDARRFLDALSEHAMKVSYATTSKSAGNREIMHVHGR